MSKFCCTILLVYVIQYKQIYAKVHPILLYYHKINLFLIKFYFRFTYFFLALIIIIWKLLWFILAKILQFSLNKKISLYINYVLLILLINIYFHLFLFPNFSLTLSLGDKRCVKEQLFILVELIPLLIRLALKKAEKERSAWADSNLAEHLK